MVISRAMIRNTFVLGLLTAASTGTGCIQHSDQAREDKKVYYHDRRVSTGSNIPRSYSDRQTAAPLEVNQSDTAHPGSANNPGRF